MPKKPKIVVPVAKDMGWGDAQVDNLYTDLRVGERIADAQNAQDTKAPTFGEQLSTAWDTESTVAALLKEIGAPDLAPDPSYNIADPAEWKRITQDIPPEYHKALLTAVSKGHADYKRQQLKQELANSQKLQGASGLAAQLGVAVLDPGALALDALLGPAAAISKAKRMERFFRGGAAAGVSNAAVEAYLNRNQELRDASDVAFAGALGFGLGGAFSALLKPKEARALNEKANQLVTDVELDVIRTSDDPSITVSADAQVVPDRVKVKEHKPAPKPKQMELPQYPKVGPQDPNRGTTLNDLRMEAGEQPNAMQLAFQKAEAEAQARAEVEAKDAEVQSAWDKWEADQLAARTKEENLAYAQRQLQEAGIELPEAVPVRETEMPPATTGAVAEQADTGVTTFAAPTNDVAKAADETAVVADETTVEAIKTTPEPVYKEGDDIIVEDANGRTLSGRIKSYDPESGNMVIIDDTTNKPRRVNLNEVDVADVMDNTGMFMPEGSIGSGQIAAIQQATPFEETTADLAESAWTHVKIPFTNFKVPIRYDYYAKFITSENSVIRRLGKVLLSDPVGDIDHAGRGLNASELASLEWHRQKGRFFTTASDAFDEYAKENGWSMVEKMRQQEAFHTAVTKAVRGNSTSQFTHPQVGKVVMEVQRIHKEMLEMAKKFGVKGAEEVLPDPFYMMRRFNHDKMLQLRSRYGNEQLIKLVKGAIKAVRPVTDEMADRVAKSYVNVVTRLQYEDMTKLRLGEAGRERLRAIAREAGVDDDLLDEVLDMTLQKPGKVEGDSPRLKSRTMLDEEYTTKLTAKDGTSEDVSMSDFFENDSRILMDMYTRQMGGLIGMARMGIRSDADFDRIVQEAQEEAYANGMDGAKLKEQTKHMRDVYNHILGRPMADEVYGTKERVLKAIRDFNFIRMMGQVGFAQLAEIGNTMGYAGIRAFTMHSPAMRDMIRMAKGGQMDDQLSKDLVNMAGLGSEMASMFPNMRSPDDMMFNQGLTKVEAGLAKGRHAVAMVSGLAPITNMLRQVSARAFVQKFSDYARKTDKLAKGDLDKLAWAGITKENINKVFADLKKYSKVSGKTDKVEAIDWEKWEKASPETYDTFRMAVWRESRRVVQENTIGETAPWMHTQVGKILTQFRGFMLVAHAKQTLYGIHHRDMTAASAFILSTVFAGLGYTAQTAMNYAGDKEALQERLTLENIAKSAFQRNSGSALIPATIDTISSFIGYDPLFKYGRSTGLASGLILGNPTVDFVFNKLGGTASNVVKEGFQDDHVWTQKDVKNAVNIVMPNLMGVRTLLEAATADLPKYNPANYQQ